MKKLLAILLFLFLTKATTAQDVWQMYPIQVNHVQLSGQDNYFTFSCYDSILQVTVVDSTPVYNYNSTFNTSSGMLAYYVDNYDYLYIVYFSVNNHIFIKDSINKQSYCHDPI